MDWTASAKRLLAAAARGSIMFLLPIAVVAGVMAALMVGQTGDMVAAVGQGHVDDPHERAVDGFIHSWEFSVPPSTLQGLNEADVRTAFVAMTDTAAFRAEVVESGRRLGQSWEEHEAYHHVVDLSRALQEAEASVAPAVADAVRANPEISFGSSPAAGIYRPLALAVGALLAAVALVLVDVLVSRDWRNVPALFAPVTVYALFLVGAMRWWKASSDYLEDELIAGWLLQRMQLALIALAVFGIAMWFVSRPRVKAHVALAL